jgi:hypothetical protein
MERMPKRSKEPWISTYDDALDRMVSWDEMQEKWYREHKARQFLLKLNHPWMWIMQSNALHRSARCLREKSVAIRDESPILCMDHHRAALMLGGMSIECAMKAQWITQFEFPLPSGASRKIFSGAHGLIALSRSAGVRTNATDRVLLGMLSHHIRWLGRYPTPKEADEYVRHELDSVIPRMEEWDVYIAFREKLGQSVSRAVKRWGKPRARIPKQLDSVLQTDEGACVEGPSGE